MEVLYVTPFVVGLALMIYIFAADEDLDGPASPYPPASVEYLAKALRLRALVCVGVSGALVTYGLVNADLVSMMKFSSPVYVLVLGGAIQRWFEAARALRALSKGAVATQHGDVVCLGRDRNVVVLRAPRGLVDRARRRGIPEARL